MNARRLQRSRLTAPEVVIVIIVIVVIGTLVAGALLPVLSRARKPSPHRNCAGNLKQIGLSLLMYSGDYDGYFPNETVPGSTNFEPLVRTKYMQDGKVWMCPFRSGAMLTTGANSAYRYIGSGLKDDNAWATGVSLAYDVSGNHENNEWMNALFIDGHVEGAKPGTRVWAEND